MPEFVKFHYSLVRVSEGFGTIISKIEDFLNKYPLIKDALIAIGTILFVYFHPILALFTAIYLIFDDIMTYMQGGDSMIGLIVDAMKNLQKNGFFSDDVPLWIQVLARAADKLDRAFTAWKTYQENKNLKNKLKIQTLKEPTQEEWVKMMEKFGQEDLQNMFSPNYLEPYIRPFGAEYNTSNDNRQIKQDIVINSNESVRAINYELAHAQFALDN